MIKQDFIDRILAADSEPGYFRYSKAGFETIKEQYDSDRCLAIVRVDKDIVYAVPWEADRNTPRGYKEFLSDCFRVYVELQPVWVPVS
jgi:hypothetical protein